MSNADSYKVKSKGVTDGEDGAFNPGSGEQTVDVDFCLLYVHFWPRDIHDLHGSVNVHARF